MAELQWSGKQQGSASALLASLQHNTPTHCLHTTTYYPPEQETDTSSCWQNRLIHGDKCAVLPALLPEFASSINLIYIDPPFMTGRTFSNGTELAYRDVWHNDLDTYLQWLYETLVLLHALLAADGSLYLHLDWRTTHYARILLDEIFGFNAQAEGPGFKNEIIWHYQSGGRARQYYPRKHDTLLFYTKSARYHFHAERIGERRGRQRRNHMRQEVGADGRVAWSIRTAGRIYTYDEDSHVTPSDVWSDINHLHQKDPERCGYATQKPLALLERILLASSEEHDLVLDCFCGSGVTPVAAERLGRRWIASDLSELAINTTTTRLLKQARTHPFVLQQCHS
jgi:site-specific DNA-methyltransferase (adenine-specific)